MDTLKMTGHEPLLQTEMKLDVP